MDREAFFRMSDRHFGGAPQITEDTCDYHGYFEGSCGDQWVFRYDKTGRALLNGGDPDIRKGGKNGWHATIDVTDGKHGLVLDLAEAFWLASCLSACGLCRRRAGVHARRSDRDVSAAERPRAGGITSTIGAGGTDDDGRDTTDLGGRAYAA